MNNLELKEIFLNENKLDLESTTVWEQWIKDNADNGAALKENNNILFRDMIGEKHFNFKDEDKNKMKVWDVPLDNGGHFWIMGAFRGQGNRYKVSNNAQTDDIKKILDFLSKKAVDNYLNKKKKKEIINEIESGFGSYLFNLDSKNHLRFFLDHPDNKDYKIDITLCEVLDEIPDFWQSYPPPIINARTVYLTIKDRTKECEFIKDSFETVMISEFTLNPSGQITNTCPPHSHINELDFLFISNEEIKAYELFIKHLKENTCRFSII